MIQNLAQVSHTPSVFELPAGFRSRTNRCRIYHVAIRIERQHDAADFAMGIRCEVLDYQPGQDRHCGPVQYDGAYKVAGSASRRLSV